MQSLTLFQVNKLLCKLPLLPWLLVQQLRKS